MLLIGTKSDAQPFESEYPGIRKIIPEEYDYFPCRKTFLTIETLFRGHDFFFAGGKHLRKVFFLILSPWIRSFLGDRASRSGDVSFRPPQLAETYLFRQHLVLPCGAAWRGVASGGPRHQAMLKKYTEMDLVGKSHLSISLPISIN